MNDKPAKLVCFGRGVDSVEYGAGCHGSGYGTPERPHAADPTRTNIPDGCPVIDKRPALETEEGFRWVFNVPLVNVDLEPETVDPCPDLSDNLMVRAMVSDGPENEFGALATLQMAHRATKQDVGPLDSVDLATYIEGWRQRGARIGQYIGGQIVWDDEQQADYQAEIDTLA